MYLVIVESPSKSKTIEKYLGKDYKVVSSKGHIRNLSNTGKYGLGVDIENDFKPTYEVLKEKKKTVADLKKEVKNADLIYLATDPDREGEAISWHLLDTLNIDKNKYKRILFNEITRNKVIDAINNPKLIDDCLVKSQETRMILDKIIGYRLSRLIQIKTEGKSAGRVQSVALKLIVDREKEISSFVSEEYWTIKALFENDENVFADLSLYHNEKVDIKTEEDANLILNNLSNNFIIDNVEKKEKKKSSKLPFITSSMQQESSTKLGFNPKKTMSLAQKLYEGIDLESETVGLITYMRTDSTRLSDEFIASTFKYIKENFGDNYIGYVKKAKSKDNVQDAHEAIRVTSINRTPESVKKYLSNDEYKLYKLIYYRTLASLMADSKTSQTTVMLNNNDYMFKMTGSIYIFDGYLKVYKDYEEVNDKIIPELFLNEKAIIMSSEIVKKQHFTEPPYRYTEAKLIKEMEELGIGRPSTYATIIDTLKLREYAIIEDKKFKPTDIGISVTERLQEFFKDIINVKYTAKMEEDLDLIAINKADNIKVLKDFYSGFESLITNAFTNMEKEKAKETGELCPLCSNQLVYRKGRFGEFIACSNYPECKYIKKNEKEIVKNIIVKCPNCEEGNIIEKTTKKNKIFYGCDNFPKCKTAYWDKPIDKKCPKCSSILLEHNKEIKCSNDNCDYKE